VLINNALKLSSFSLRDVDCHWRAELLDCILCVVQMWGFSLAQTYEEDPEMLNFQDLISTDSQMHTSHVNQC